MKEVLSALLTDNVKRVMKKTRAKKKGLILVTDGIEIVFSHTQLSNKEVFTIIVQHFVSVLQSAKISKENAHTLIDKLYK